jgi:predicted TPR repeat methyltransferase
VQELQRRAAGRALDVLDAGCGTGLCGPLLRPQAKRLVGLDLSRAMLDRAQARGSYDQLIQAELTAWLSIAQAAFDAIVSADTLCYFGPLPAVLAGARRAARTNAIFVFTVEALDEADAQGWRLQPHGRYAHDRGAVQAWLKDAGWERADARRVELRHEAGLPVAGWLFSAIAAP